MAFIMRIAVFTLNTYLAIAEYVESVRSPTADGFSIKIVSKPVSTAIFETRYEVVNIEPAYVFGFQD